MALAVVLRITLSLALIVCIGVGMIYADIHRLTAGHATMVEQAQAVPPPHEPRIQSS